MRVLASLLLVVAVAVPSMGCASLVVREAKGAIAGASGEYRELSWNSSVDRGPYGAVVVGPISDEMCGCAPASLLAETRAAVRRELLRDGWGAGAPSLLITGAVVHYEGLGGLLDRVTGPFEELVVRVTLSDSSSGDIVGIANCIGRSDANTSAGARSEGAGRRCRHQEVDRRTWCPAVRRLHGDRERRLPRQEQQRALRGERVAVRAQVACREVLVRRHEEPHHTGVPRAALVLGEEESP